MRKYQLGL